MVSIVFANANFHYVYTAYVARTIKLSSAKNQHPILILVSNFDFDPTLPLLSIKKNWLKFEIVLNPALGIDST